MYFQLQWFQQRAVADVLNMQKIKITLSHKQHNGQIFYTGSGAILFPFEIHENT